MIIFKGPAPFKYMVLKTFHNKKDSPPYLKEESAFYSAVELTDETDDFLSKGLHINRDDLDNLLTKKIGSVSSSDSKNVEKNHIKKFLNIVDNINKLSYYNELN